MQGVELYIMTTLPVKFIKTAHHADSSKISFRSIFYFVKHNSFY